MLKNSIVRRSLSRLPTFVIDQEQTIRFSKISKTHGGRAPVDDVVDGLSKI